ncbi:MAG: c-type cytochrome, partial [Gammaproteobacteria bacterium]|nr:c-type cytochrome [Gammaproteobacteria bacterium]
MKKTVLFAAMAAVSVSVTAQADSIAADAGKKTYDTACFACHSTGAAGAPKVADKAAWKDRIAQGDKVLNDHAIKGFQGKKGFMPAKGGRADLTDQAVAD